MAKQQLSALDSGVLKIVRTENEPIKGQAIFDKLSATDAVQPHEVARSIWRLVDSGQVTVRADQGVLLAGDAPTIRR